MRQGLRDLALLGAHGIGGPIAAASWRDYTDKAKRQFLLDTTVEGFQAFARIAARHRKKFLPGNPRRSAEMSISIDVFRALYERMNRGSTIPIHMQLDVGHWCS